MEPRGQRERPRPGAGRGRAGLHGRGAGGGPCRWVWSWKRGKKRGKEGRERAAPAALRGDRDLSPLLRSTATAGPRTGVDSVSFPRRWSDLPPPDRYFYFKTEFAVVPPLPSSLPPPPRPFAPAVTPGSRTPFPSVTLSDPNGVAIGPCPVASIVPVLCIITSPKKKGKKKYKGHIFFFPFCNRKEIVAKLLNGWGFHNFQHYLVFLVLF